jgi:hypothetical protein
LLLGAAGTAAAVTEVLVAAPCFARAASPRAALPAASAVALADLERRVALPAAAPGYDDAIFERIAALSNVRSATAAVAAVVTISCLSAGAAIESTT